MVSIEKTGGYGYVVPWWNSYLLQENRWQWEYDFLFHYCSLSTYSRDFPMNLGGRTFSYWTWYRIENNITQHWYGTDQNITSHWILSLSYLILNRVIFTTKIFIKMKGVSQHHFILNCSLSGLMNHSNDVSPFHWGSVIILWGIKAWCNPGR